MISSSAMPSNKKKAPPSEQDYAVGDHVKVNLHTGRIVDATVKAVIEHTGGKRLQVDFGKDETALVHLWQVVELTGPRASLIRTICVVRFARNTGKRL
jgi:hypothetical protein